MRRAPQRLYQTTWYDFALQRLNPDDLDWGAWLEQRRQAFLEATVTNPYFKYSLVTTGLLLFTWLVLTKVWVDRRRMLYLAQEHIDDLRRHDQWSRAAAREAIARYNNHIEKCNRVIETPPRANATDDLQSKLEDAGERITELERERAALAGELERANDIVTTLTRRLDTVGNTGNGGSGANQPNGGPSMTDLVKQVSELQEQLYRERERNKRLKGM